MPSDLSEVSPVIEEEVLKEESESQGAEDTNTPFDKEEVKVSNEFCKTFLALYLLMLSGYKRDFQRIKNRLGRK